MDNKDPIAKKLHTYKILTFIFLVVIIFGSLISAFIISFYKFSYASSGYEIERKWLIDPEKIPYDLSRFERQELSQTYINFSPEIRVRSINDMVYILAIKSDLSVDGLKRTEKEYYISKEEYDHLLEKGDGMTIKKTRYQHNIDNLVYEIDVFKDSLAGLAYLEIEFKSEEEANAFQEPDWVIKDVTADIRYKNGQLAQYGIPK